MKVNERSESYAKEMNQVARATVRGKVHKSNMGTVLRSKDYNALDGVKRHSITRDWFEIP